MKDHERFQVEWILRKAHKGLAKVEDTIRAYQEFLSEDNLALFNAWCEHLGSDVSREGFAINRSGVTLTLRFVVNGMVCSGRVLLDDRLFSHVPSILPLCATKI